jgi:hypothetical protein
MSWPGRDISLLSNSVFQKDLHVLKEIWDEYGTNEFFG